LSFVLTPASPKGMNDIQISSGPFNCLIRIDEKDMKFIGYS